MAKSKPQIRISELKKLTELHCSDQEIADYFGLSLKRWRKLKEEDKLVRAAVASGESNGKISLRRKQMQLAGHNASMAIHLGKNLLDQADKNQVELTGANGGPIQQEFDFSKLSSDERSELRKTLEKAAKGDKHG